MNAASPATLTARAAARSLRQVVATTDVHSSLDRAGILVRSLRELRAAGALIVDCGDFFEGTGYYVLGRGRAEAALLRGLYDVAAPGNHGYRHYVTDPGLRAMTVCANVKDRAGAPVWQPLTMAEVRGSATAVTAVLGVEAFGSVLPTERHRHQAHDPASALHALHDRYHGTVDSWIVLSHSGFSHDLLLARACPFIDVIFAGHCHSPEHGPRAAGGAVVVKGAELAAGYSAAWPDDPRWHAETRRFADADPGPASGDLPGDLDHALAYATGLRAHLTQILGPVPPGSRTARRLGTSC
jgi:2',3'-cyclic-nucleotide 2'-phosphodiesterase (5'-nucleotidase family)